MGTRASFMINKSGVIYPLYEQGTGRYLGQINNRESYIELGGEGSSMAIKFLNPNGSFVQATIDIGAHELPSGFETPCTSYPLETMELYGRYYKIYLMRRTMPVYNQDGSRWGTVAAWQRVATDNSDVGQTHPDWKEVTYVEKTNGIWSRIGNYYGFVDTGISSASGYGSIPFYGSW